MEEQASELSAAVSIFRVADHGQPTRRRPPHLVAVRPG